ncbi:MAG: nickel-responsive transcriptional regulator NikR [Candidatus Methanosuratus sp.]|nr:nickel-responsive transcriptional regulator NikR [Candidatus Methanosuratincola sp.]
MGKEERENRKGVERFSISVEPDLVREFDSVVERLGEKRSKALQHAMRLFLSEHYWTEIEGECTGAVVIVYDHSTRMVEEGITDLQHGFRDVINSTLHIHVDERDCLEIVAVRGRIRRVKELIEGLEKGKGVKQVKHTIVFIEQKK